MRIDKFLKVSRIIKRRTVAKEMCDNGRVLLNGIVAKSSSSVSVGDQITILFGNKTVTVEIKQILDSTKKEDAREMFEIIAE
jgi:ribosomal 50S subunit-recycling heat shock protein